MFSRIDPYCDCGKLVGGNIWPCKHCGRLDPRRRIRPGGYTIGYDHWPHPRRPLPTIEPSYVFNPYVPR